MAFIDLLDKPEKEKPLRTSWSKDEHGVLKLHIPEGYKYCSECDSFTPHTIYKDKYSSGTITCGVCDYERYDWDSCDHCGYYFGDGEEHFAPDSALTLKKHHDGCHFKEDGVDLDSFVYLDWTCFNVGHVDMNTHAGRILKSFFDTLTDKDMHRLHIMLRRQSDMTCGCPEIPVIPVDKCVGYKQHSVYSIDCMNAMEWEYELRCPICNELKYFADGNC